MTTGEKLTKLRRENNFTQEQLADLVGVSRQAVSKWESDLAYPETEKLLKLGELYHCSMDYLLKEDIDDQTEPASAATPSLLNLFSWHYEKKSRKTVHGVPLWHINIGLGRTAKGIFAIGFSARGVVSVGLFSVGVCSLGVCSLGVLSLGVLAVGLLAAGCLAAGLAALGALSFGVMAVGAAAIGDFSIGALAVGKYFACGDHAYGMIAIGKTLAEGDYTAPSLAAADASTVFRMLDASVPAIWDVFKALVKMLFP